IGSAWTKRIRAMARRSVVGGKSDRVTANRRRSSDVIGRIRIPSLRREDFKVDRKHCSSALKAVGSGGLSSARPGRATGLNHSSGHKCVTKFRQQSQSSQSRLPDFVMDADGGNVRLIANTKGRGTSPRWSPDGKKLVFISMLSGKN